MEINELHFVEIMHILKHHKCVYFNLKQSPKHDSKNNNAMAGRQCSTIHPCLPVLRPV